MMEVRLLLLPNRRILTFPTGCMTFSRHGCEDRAKYFDPPIPADEFPLLKQSSDMLWALWELDVPIAQRGNINFFISLSIENKATLQIIKRALDQTEKQLSPNPVVFDMSSEEGRAIMGKS